MPSEIIVNTAVSGIRTLLQLGEYTDIVPHLSICIQGFKQRIGVLAVTSDL
jgi:hypothetical protein